jgi:4-hydroxy-tetrahydrodipicolinate synthase
MFTGVIPATVVPFKSDFSIDEAQLRREIRFLAAVPGVSGLACNGHAGEAFALRDDEIRRVTEIHVDEVGGRIPIICGLESGATYEAIEKAKNAKSDGAAGVLVMPPDGLGSAILRPEPVFDFFSDLADGSDVPIVVFRYGNFGVGNKYTPETLAKLTEIPLVVAVKDAAWDQKVYEQDVWALRHAPRRVTILNASDWTMFPTFVIGADGALISLADLVPHWIVEMFAAVQRGDLATGQELNNRLYPIVEALTTVGGFLAIKEMLYMLGVLEHPAVSRPPARALTSGERLILWRAIEESGLRSVYQKDGYEARPQAQFVTSR